MSILLLKCYDALLVIHMLGEASPLRRTRPGFDSSRSRAAILSCTTEAEVRAHVHRSETVQTVETENPAVENFLSFMVSLLNQVQEHNNKYDESVLTTAAASGKRRAPGNWLLARISARGTVQVLCGGFGSVSWTHQSRRRDQQSAGGLSVIAAPLRGNAPAATSTSEPCAPDTHRDKGLIPAAEPPRLRAAGIA